MTEQVVRGNWLTGGVKFLRTRYSPETNERLLGTLSKPFRAMLAEIQPVQWYPRGHHVDILRAIVSAHRDETIAYESLLAHGQLAAADAANGPLQPLIRISTPKLLVKKLPNLWVNDHQDDGKLDADIAHVDDARLSLRLTALHGYEHVGIVMLGWVKGLLMALGRRDVVARQTGWSLEQPTPNEMKCEVRWS